MKLSREQFGFSVSHTTRSPRPGEQTGKDYHFISRWLMMQYQTVYFDCRVEMEALVEEGAFLEHAVFGGNMYGTSRTSVAKVGQPGQDLHPRHRHAGRQADQAEWLESKVCLSLESEK